MLLASPEAHLSITMWQFDEAYCRPTGGIFTNDVIISGTDGCCCCWSLVVVLDWSYPNAPSEAIDKEDDRIHHDCLPCSETC